jgi:hypothetical protein
MEILIAIDALDDLIHNAKLVPLTDQVRLDPKALRAATERLRPAALAELGPLPQRIGPVGDVFHAIDELEAIARDAKPIPLTGQVRVPKTQLYDRLDELHAALPEAIRAQRGATPS